MPRTRDVIVPNAVKGIEDVIVTHTKTKRGTRTREKVIPVVLPKPEGSGQSSKSKKGSPANSQPNTPGSERAIPTEVPAEYVEDAQFPGEQDYGFPDPIAEPRRPQASVCALPNPHGWPH